MTPKQKYKELVDKFKDIKDAYYIDEQAKKRALIAVDEIINAIEYLDDDSEYFWEQVKQELEKL